MSFGTIGPNLPLYYSALSNLDCETPPSSHGCKQLDEMLVPRDVELENDPTLIAEGKAFANELQAKLDSLTIPDKVLKELVTDIERFDFQNAPLTSTLLNTNLPYFAIEALRRGFLDHEHGPKQVATILNFWGALQYHGKDQTVLQTIDLTDRLAESLITQTCYTYDFVEKATSIPYLDGTKYNDFIEKTSRLPLSEQRFLLVPDIQGEKSREWIDSNQSEATISQALKVLSFNVFGRVEHDEQPMRIVPSMGMMQAFLDAQHKEPVKIRPTLYLSTEMQIRECGLSGRRDMLMPFPDGMGNNRSPATADGVKAPWYDFIIHDFSHADAASALGKTYRQAIIRASDAIIEFGKTTPPESRKGLGELANTLMDMDLLAFKHYSIPIERPPSQRFWEALNDRFDVLQNRMSEKSSDILGALKYVYEFFVIQKKGSVEIDKTSFDVTIQFKNSVRQKKVTYETVVAMDELYDIYANQYSEQMSLLLRQAKLPKVQEEMEEKYNNQPVLLLNKTLNTIQ